jgi:hypothetical protein
MQGTSYYTDGDATTDLLLEANGTFTSGEAVEDPSNTADPITIDQNEYTELEFAVTPTVNVVDQNLCLRVTHLGDPLDTYLRVAKMALRFDPVLSNVTFNDGATISLIPGTTTRVYATGTVTDLNGYTDFASGAATSTMYTSSSTASCSADNNDCYITTNASQCSYTGCSGNSCELVCYADFYYHANPTDSNGTDWFAFLEVEDSSEGYDFATSLGIDVATLYALDVTETINYGSLAVGASSTAATNASSTVENLGNAAIDIDVEGTDLSDGYSSTIPVNYQKLATTTFNYAACVTCSTLSTTTALLELDLAKPTAASPYLDDVVYWGIAIPFGISSAQHSGTNTFYAVGD